MLNSQRRTRSTGWTHWTRGAGLALAVGVTAGLAHAELPVEQPVVATLAPATPYRLYLSDMVISHFVDGKLMLIDGATMKVQGHVALGMAGHATLSPDRSEIYVATAYFTKLNRGERVAELDVYDAQTLKLKAEIAVPNKHSQSMPYRGAVRSSADGRFIFLQNATPAQSVTVVDRQAEKFVTEVATPGCWMIYPAQSVPNRFATLCGDGTMLTVTLDAQGQVAERHKSAKFFDADADALFVAGEQDGDRYTFVSFLGDVQVVDVGGPQAQPQPRWSLLNPADRRAGWRPGGYQPLSLQVASGRLYVAMHPQGKEGSHKAPAREIWAFDLASQARVARLPGHQATAIATSRGEAPRLFALATESGVITAYALGAKPRKLQTSTPFAEFGTQLDAQ